MYKVKNALLDLILIKIVYKCTKNKENRIRRASYENVVFEKYPAYTIF